MKKFIPIVLIIAGLWAWNSEQVRLLTGRWSFTRSVETDRGTYFRLVMDFTYRGEPQHFDVVFGCNARITRYKDGGSSYEPGLTPQLYGRLMSDGQIVAVRTPLACKGETTANGKVPDAILPLMLVYPIAEKPEFAVAYATSDAYRSPHAELTRPKARIEAATNADFMAFRARADNALARPAPGAASIAEKALSTHEAAKTGFKVADYCEAFLRIRLPEPVRALVREHWPEDRPPYWTGLYVTKREGPNQWNLQPPVDEVRAAIMSDDLPELSVRADTLDDPPSSLDRLTWASNNENQGMPNAENARMRDQGVHLGAVYPSGLNTDLTDPAKTGRHLVPGTRSASP